MLGAEDVGAAAPQERPELQQVGPVRLERVAREPALELEVREEVEDVMLERPRLRGGVDGHVVQFAVSRLLPRRCNGACAVHAPLRGESRPPGVLGAPRVPAQLTANVALTIWVTSGGIRQPKRERVPTVCSRPLAVRRRLGVRIVPQNLPGPKLPSAP